MNSSYVNKRDKGSDPVSQNVTGGQTPCHVLHFYIGGSGAGKSRAVFARIIAQSMAEPRRRFLVIVPEQATMETQRQIVRLHPRHGILNIDILSMTRLAYRVFGELGVRREAMLEEIGKTFLLEKIALEERRNLAYFGPLLPRPEYLAEMKALLSEMMVYGITPQMLKKIAGEDGSAAGRGRADSLFERKLRDIELVYRRFRERLEGSYMTAEELPERLSGLVGQSKLFRDAVLVLDGFTGFTPLQYKLIEKLMPLVSDLYVTVTADPERNPYAPYSETDLFALGYETVRRLKALADVQHMRLDPTVYIRNGEESRHGAAPQLMKLERGLFRGRRKKMAQAKDMAEAAGGSEAETDGAAADASAAIRLIATSTARAEIDFAADEICRLVREEGYRYRDFAVVSGDPDTYGSYVRERFCEADIPYFVDEKRRLTLNPFMEYLRAALEAVTDQYSYTGMFRMLKSGIPDFDPDAVDHLENYVIACGIRGKRRWREPFVRHYSGEDPGEVPLLDALRAEICALLDPLADVCARRGSTVREKTAALYDFCVRSRAEEKLEERRAFLEADGRGELSREYAQVWPYVVSFLEKLDHVLGDEVISMQDFRALIEAGFGEARVAVIPPGSDRVLVGDMERSRLSDIRVLFFVGVNEGLIPKVQRGGGLLSEADRAALSNQGIALKPAARTQLFIDRFYLYLTLTKPSERLYLTHAATSPAGETLRPAYLIGALRRLFPELNEEVRAGRAEEAQRRMPEAGRAEEDAYRVSLRLPERMSSGIPYLTEILAGVDRGMPSLPEKELFAWYLTDPAYERRSRMLLDAAAVRKTPDRISRATARALYGDVLRGSASRLEEYAACRFAHFLAYGMRLKERREYTFSEMDLGSILHNALEIFDARVRKTGCTWASLRDDPKTRGRLAKESVREAVRAYGGDLFEESARDRYAVQRMERLMAQTAWTQAEALAAGDFAPVGAEIGFDNLAAWTEELSGGCRMELTGRIDRLDTCEDGDATLVKIVDYKTGRVSFDFTQVYYGLQLQLAIYLDAAMDLLRSKGRHPVPAGMFYVQVQDPLVDYIGPEAESATAERRLKEMRASGVVLADAETVRHFDASLAPGTASSVVPVELKRDGSYAARASVIGAEGFYAIGAHARRLARRFAEEIMDGHAEMDPYALGNDTACTYCPFRGICGFDRRVPGCRYRRLLPMKADEAIERMQEPDGEDEAAADMQVTDGVDAAGAAGQVE